LLVAVVVVRTLHLLVVELVATGLLLEHLAVTRRLSPNFFLQ
jgi:hypothetical protein